MTNISFMAKGCFPLYFRYPEIVAPIFDRLGFSQGFKRTHPSGLSLYIHRAKNKKETVPIGITIPLLVKNTKEFLDSLHDLPITIENTNWFGHSAFQLELPEQKYFLVVQEDHFLPSTIQYQAKQSSAALFGEGTFILNTKNPLKTAAWYEEFLECETVYRSEETAITMMTNQGEKTPGLTIIHKLEKNSKKIGPLQYKNFCLTTKNIYACWKYLESKNKINPRWKSPQEDGIYRTILLTAPDGYAWKIYGEIPIYNQTLAAELINQPIEKLQQFIKDGLIPVLDNKFLKNIPDDKRDPPYICEDHLLQFLWKKSPYQNKLNFKN